MDTYVHMNALPGVYYYDTPTMVICSSIEKDAYLGLMSFRIPSSIMNQTIIYSHLTLTSSIKTSGRQINIYKNLTSFTSNVTWDTKPIYDTRVVDYHIIGQGSNLIFDITKPVKEWQFARISQVPGFTFADDEGYGAHNSVRTMESTTKPIITIGYMEPSGLKDYWTYTSQDMGMVGTGYVSDYTGNLTFVRNDFNFQNELMPLNLVFYYNTYNRYLDIGYGFGWKTNYNLKVFYDPISLKYYMFSPDGNKVYFMNEVLQGTDFYSIAEDGSGNILIRKPSSYIIQTKSGIEYLFSSNGKLTKITDKKTSHYLTIYYESFSSDRIDFITDEKGNKIDFTYGIPIVAKLQLRQADGSMRTVEEKKYHFGAYGNLDKIEQGFSYNDQDMEYNHTLQYSFNINHFLLNAYDETNNYKVKYQYDSNYRVQTVTYTDSNSTTCTDLKPYIFADFYEGQAPNYYDTDFSPYVNWNYAKAQPIEATQDNFVMEIVDEVTGDFIGRCFEFLATNDLSPELLAIFDEREVLYYGTIGGYSSLYWNPEAQYWQPTIYQPYEIGITSFTYYFNKTVITDHTGDSINYTFDNYGHTVNIIDSKGNAVFYKYTGLFTFLNGELADDGNVILFPYNEYDILGTTVTPNYYNNHKLIEASDVMKQQYESDYEFYESRENEVTNHSFESSINEWYLYNANRVSINESGTMRDILGNYAMKIDGDGQTLKYFEQDVTGIFYPNETYIIGGWAKANAVPNKVILENGKIVTDKRFFGLKLKFEFFDGDTFSTYLFPFNPSTSEWQYLMYSIQVPYQSFENLRSIKIIGAYQGEGTAYFDNLQVYHGKLGTDYNYDKNNGNLIKMVDSTGSETSYDYNSDNFIRTQTTDGIRTDIGWTSSNQISSIENNVKVSYYYDPTTKQLMSSTYGEITDRWFKNSITYTTDKQYIKTTKDEFGHITTYDIDSLTSLISKIHNALGDYQSFSYDAYGNIISNQQVDVSSGETSNNSFTYDSYGRLWKISRNGFNYEIVYDDLDRIQSVKVANETVKTNTYKQETHNSVTYQTGKIGSLTYGNGDNISFVYDDEDRVERISYNGIVKYRYEYDASGRLAKYIDIDNDNTFTYYYDLAGRIKNIIDKVGNEISCQYDRFGNVCNYSYVINGSSRTIDYIYESLTGMYDKATYVASGNIIKKDYNYSTDSLKRLNSIDLMIGSANTLTKVFDYDDSKVNSIMGNATNRVYSIQYKKNGSLIKTYQYTYDELNQITCIKVISSGVTIEQYDYSYDGFGQLIRENYKDVTKQYTKTFTYENGNIKAIKEFAYTTSINLPANPVKEQRFYYNNVWKDQISDIENYSNGILAGSKSLYYDSIGNPTSIVDEFLASGDTLEFEGRILKRYVQSYRGGERVFTYTYNDQGIRTSKIIDGVRHSYELDGNRVLVEKIGTNIISYTYDADGSLISMNYNGTEYFYVTNLQGDIIEIVDCNGNTLVTYKYDAWGKLISSTDTSGFYLSTKNPYRYRGYRYDVETSLYYCNSRYYNPEWGRWLNADDISYLDPSSENGLNLFAYCGNNPVMNIDPYGNFPIAIPWTGVVIIGIVALACLVLYTPPAQEAIRDTLEAGAKAIDDALDSIGQAVKDSIKTLITINAIVTVLSSARKPYENHHIVPQTARKCEGAREILKRVGIGINSPSNIIILEYDKHHGIHTNDYYNHVEATIQSAYIKNGSDFLNRIRVEAALMELRWEIMTGVW